MKIVGYNNCKNGGYMVYGTNPFNGNYGCGVRTESFFLPERICAELDYVPALDDVVIPVYQRNSNFLSSLIVRPD